MAKLPYMQFFPADWLLDTLLLSPAARGIWIDILSFMWRAEPRTGTMECTVAGWCKRLRCSDADFRLVVEEFELEHICDVVKDECKDIVRFTSRRIVRDETLRENGKLYVRKHRSKKACKTDVRQMKGPCKGENQNHSHISKSESDIKEDSCSSQMSGAFEQFWKVYPRKVGKKAAMKAWDKIKDRPPVLHLTEAIARALQTDQWKKDNGQFIPYPATWLNEGRWDDEPMGMNGATSTCQERVQRGAFLKPCGAPSVGQLGGRPLCQQHKEYHESKSDPPTA